MSAAKKSKIGWLTWGILTGAAVVAFGVLACSSITTAHAQPASQPVVKIMPAAPAPSPAAVAPSAVQGLLDVLLKLAGIAAATAVPLLLKRWLAAKVSTETLAQLTELASQGVGVAEEAAHQAVKRGLAPPSGSEKLEVAAKYVLETAERLGLVGVAQSAVKTMIESRLGSTRA